MVVVIVVDATVDALEALDVLVVAATVDALVVASTVDALVVTATVDALVITATVAALGVVLALKSTRNYKSCIK